MKILSTSEALDPVLSSDGLTLDICERLVDILGHLVEYHSIGSHYAVVRLKHGEHDVLVYSEANSNFALVQEEQLVNRSHLVVEDLVFEEESRL